jgi:hypothetical protein
VFGDEDAVNDVVDNAGGEEVDPIVEVVEVEAVPIVEGKLASPLCATSIL